MYVMDIGIQFTRGPKEMRWDILKQYNYLFENILMVLQYILIDYYCIALKYYSRRGWHVTPVIPSYTRFYK